MFHADPQSICHFLPLGEGPWGGVRSELIFMQTEDPESGRVSLVSIHSGIAEAYCVLGAGDTQGNQTGQISCLPGGHSLVRHGGSA